MKKLIGRLIAPLVESAINHIYINRYKKACEEISEREAETGDEIAKSMFMVFGGLPADFRSHL